MGLEKVYAVVVSGCGENQASIPFLTALNGFVRSAEPMLAHCTGEITSKQPQLFMSATMDGGDVKLGNPGTKCRLSEGDNADGLSSRLSCVQAMVQLKSDLRIALHDRDSLREQLCAAHAELAALTSATAHVTSTVVPAGAPKPVSPSHQAAGEATLAV